MWIDDYVKMMFTPSIQDMDKEGAEALKLKHLPPSLFKYRSINNYSIENLKNDEFWFSPVRLMNDPYDSLATIDDSKLAETRYKYRYYKWAPTILKDNNREVIPSDLENFRNQSLEEVLRYLGTDMNSEHTIKILGKPQKEIPGFRAFEINMLIRNKVHISCFSERNDSVLMWSHYTNNHTGFCIEYDFQRPDINPKIIEGLFPVIYTDKLVDLTSFREQAIWDYDNVNLNCYIHPVMNKSTQWEYEKEWRFASGPGAKLQYSGYNYKFFPPKAIYLGTNISGQDRLMLIDIAKEKGIPIFQMHMSNNQFGLIPKKIS